MTINFRVSSFLCLLAAFIWQIGTETQWVAGNHEEEEEKKLNVVFGNLSFKSTLSPYVDNTTKTPLAEATSPGNEHESTSGPHLDKTKTNLTGYGELRVDENKNDASPENTVDRDSSELNNSLYKENSKTETVSTVDSGKETTTEMDKTSTSNENTFSATDVIPGNVSNLHNATCSGDDPKCKTDSKSSPSVRTEPFESPRVEEKVTFVTSSALSSSVSPPLWNIVKSLKPIQVSPVTFTPFKTSVNAETITVNTESTTTVQTSENLIPVEGLGINKLDSATDVSSNKSEKSKLNKQSELADDSLLRTVAKTTHAIPVTTVSTADENPEPTTLLSKMFEVVSVTASFPTDSYHETNTTATDVWSSEVVYHPTPKKDFEDKKIDIISSSSIPPHSELPTELHSPFLPLFTTPSWNNPKSSVSAKEGSAIKDDTEVTPHLFPSFRESSSSTKKSSEEMTASSFEEVNLVSSYAATDSLSYQFVSTLAPQINSRLLTKDTTTTLPTVKEEYIPPPRLTNPGCSSLPVCIEITLVDTTWDEFCPQAREFQNFLSKAVSHYTRPLHHHQIIIEAETCTQSSPIYPVQASSDVNLALYMTDDNGEYSEKLTEICALILRKWAPTSFRSSVMEVRLFNSEFQSTSIPVIPELNSGFVAAVSISAVAGVALCMLCILLVVMKQKLLQSRNSETTSPADAYSLDSLSINASFRRRRNRRSARSYLNHAFSDQEIPSHPLNEKSLQNCLKNRDLLEEEFKKIPMNMPKLDQIPEGAHVKNRYSNILPKPESRVVLAEPSGDPLKCYINANYVKGYGGKASTYIACQAPLPEGIEDFWRMIWEQQCRVIIMLTMFEENGISRCAMYFPQSTLISNPPYGDFQVSLLKKDVYEFYTMSTLRLLDLEKNLFRDVVHLWYTSWPDVGVPKDPSILITFVQQCRSFINCNAGPTVVHCSTGTGRTGVFIALDICMREFDESRSIDILQCISQLRRDRGGAVQNKDQYILIHEAMLEYISRMANQSQRSSIQS